MKPCLGDPVLIRKPKMMQVGIISHGVANPHINNNVPSVDIETSQYYWWIINAYVVNISVNSNLSRVIIGRTRDN